MKNKLPFDKTNGFNHKDWNAIVEHAMELPKSRWEVSFGKPGITSPQMRSMWLFCTNLAVELNSIEKYLVIKSILTGLDIEKQWDKDRIKEHIWNPVMEKATGKKSSTKLTTKEVDEVADPIIKTMKDAFNLRLLFPSQLSKHLEKQAEKLNSNNSA